MKVANISKVPSGMQNVAAPGSAQLDTGAGFSFSRHMSDFNDAQYQKYLEELRNRIFAQGEIIKKKADIGEFLQYRKLIAELLGEAASNAYACNRTHAFDSKGRRNAFVLIKKVNSRLDDMAQEILSEQSDNITLLEMVDEIRGLLVDIFL
jgi:uncharacterized protein